MLVIAVSALSALQWQQVGYPINGSNPNEQFGHSTTLSNNGSVLAIGKVGSTSSPPQVYKQTSTSGSPTWDQLTVQETAIPSLGAPKSVHFSADAEFLAVGYPNKGTTTTNSDGVTLLYKRGTDTTTGNPQYVYFTSPGSGPTLSFAGDTVTIFNSTGTIGVMESRPFEAIGNADYGDVMYYILDANENFFVSSGSIKPLEYTNQYLQIVRGEQFGISMDASDDGKTVVVGNNQGQIWWFRWSDTEDKYGVTGPIPYDESTTSSNVSVSMSSDGQRTAVGNGAAKSVVIWDTFGVGTPPKIESPDPEPVNFGYSVSLSGDGKRLAIGDPGYDNNKGRVYIYHEQSTGNWAQLGQTIDGDSNGEGTGAHVTMSGDGTTVAVSAPEYTTDANEYVGKVKIYEAVINDDNKDDDGLSTGAVVGIAVGATAGAAAIGATAYYTVPFLFTGGKYKPVDQPFL